MKKRNEIKSGDRVRTIYGKTETILRVYDSTVVTYENPNNRYHITKVFKI